MKLLVILLTVAVTLLPQAGLAQEEDARVSAEKLLGLFKMNENLENSFSQVLKMQKNLLKQQNLPAEAEAKALTRMESAVNEVKEQFQWEKVKDIFIDIYAEVFTKEELDDLIAFFESPPGQKFIQKQPQLQAATMRKMQGMMMQMMPKIRQATEEAQKEAAAPPPPSAEAPASVAE